MAASLHHLTNLKHPESRFILRTPTLPASGLSTNGLTGSCADFSPKANRLTAFQRSRFSCLQTKSTLLPENGWIITLRMSSLRPTSTRSMRFLMFKLCSDRCSICYCNLHIIISAVFLTTVAEPCWKQKRMAQTFPNDGFYRP